MDNTTIDITVAKNGFASLSEVDEWIAASREALIPAYGGIRIRNSDAYLRRGLWNASVSLTNRPEGPQVLEVDETEW